MAHHRGQTTSAGVAERGEGRVTSVPSRTLRDVGLRRANGATLHIKLLILWLCFGSTIFPLGKSSVSLVSYLERECCCCLRPPPKSKSTTEVQDRGQSGSRSSVGVYRYFCTRDAVSLGTFLTQGEKLPSLTWKWALRVT